MFVIVDNLVWLSLTAHVYALAKNWGVSPGTVNVKPAADAVITITGLGAKDAEGMQLAGGMGASASSAKMD
jgi:hypothetical protein